jgi:transcriptional regulator with XRE-family HTH domain/tetratricopeptide (TPR) repeat protein
MNQEKFGDTCGMDQGQISRYELGKTVPSEKSLRRMAKASGFEWAHVGQLRQFYSAFFAAAARETAGPTVKASGFTSKEPVPVEVAAYLIEAKSAHTGRPSPQEELQEAEQIWTALAQHPIPFRRRLIEISPRSGSWALAVRVCEASLRMAAHNAEEALELAELALSIAERVPGEESWRSRLQGYCWAYVGNARRVANDHAAADEAFARAWDLWRTGAKAAPELLPEWRLFSLEASLRRAQHRFSAALELLDKAQERSGGHQPVVVAQVLLQKGNIFEQMRDFGSALAELMKAAPLVEDFGDPRMIFGLCFDTANNLQYLGQYKQAAELLPRVRDLAVQQGNELDLLRLLWLESKVKAGQNQRGEALAGLEQVRQDFTARSMSYDAALSGLDLAMLLLKEGRTGEVKELALTMGWIFTTQGIAREALAALQLFCNAASQEAATVELARKVIADIEQARRSAPPLSVKERGRG